MKIHKVTLDGFRGYGKKTSICFGDLTAFVGRNDIGKSSILEALDLFFNDGKGAIKFDEGDLNVYNQTQEFSIDITFTDLPDTIVVDSSFQTNFEDEYLLNEDGELELIKKFNGKKCTAVLIRALHPINGICADLLLKKKKDLQAIIRDNNIICANQSINSVMRRAVWSSFADELELTTIDIDVTAGEDTKKIWEQLSKYLPVYSLFQADRENSDKDAEVQDPLKLAVSQFFQDAAIQETLKSVAEQIESRLLEVSYRTLSKLREMDPNMADNLKPVIPSPTAIKWAKVFEGVSLSSEDDIPINKRGSGVKRLVLLNFFRAEAERRQEENDSTGIIYAIEEPETSQHFSNQKMLADALKELSHSPRTQIIVTTHSGVIVKQLQYSDLRLINVDTEGNKHITPTLGGLLGYPSMNEINYTAFNEVTEEYHDELYGFIAGNNWMKEYEHGKPTRNYTKILPNASTQLKQHTLSHYIRDVSHHPENQLNAKYSDKELAQSIEDMRTFIQYKLNT